MTWVWEDASSQQPPLFWSSQDMADTDSEPQAERGKILNLQSKTDLNRRHIKRPASAQNFNNIIILQTLSSR